MKSLGSSNFSVGASSTHKFIMAYEIALNGFHKLDRDDETDRDHCIEEDEVVAETQKDLDYDGS